MQDTFTISLNNHEFTFPTDARRWVLYALENKTSNKDKFTFLASFADQMRSLETSETSCEWERAGGHGEGDLG